MVELDVFQLGFSNHALQNFKVSSDWFEGEHLSAGANKFGKFQREDADAGSQVGDEIPAIYERRERAHGLLTA